MHPQSNADNALNVIFSRHLRQEIFLCKFALRLSVSTNVRSFMFSVAYAVERINAHHQRCERERGF